MYNHQVPGSAVAHCTVKVDQGQTTHTRALYQYNFVLAEGL